MRVDLRSGVSGDAPAEKQRLRGETPRDANSCHMVITELEWEGEVKLALEYP